MYKLKNNTQSAQSAWSAFCSLHGLRFNKTDVTSFGDSLCLRTFAQGLTMLSPRSSLAITIQGFKKYNLRGLLTIE